MKNQKIKKRIYLDYASLTPISPLVAKVVVDAYKNFPGNPGSLHREGQAAKQTLLEARENIATYVGAHSDEIIFTSGGTEGDNMAILGTITNYELKIKNDPEKSKLHGAGKLKIKPHIITTTIEHSAVLETCRHLEKTGRVEVTYVSVDEQGRLNLSEFKKSLRENTVLVSVMYVNNEIGTIEPIEEIAKTIRHYKKLKIKNEKLKINENYYPLFHTDAAQAISHIPIRVEKLGVDLMSWNGSKLYGPTGIGALYVKRGTPIAPIMFGGEQEYGLRPGTENIPLILGFEKAMSESIALQTKESQRLYQLRSYTVDVLIKNFPEILIHGSKSEEYFAPHILSVSFAQLESELLVIELDAKGFALSSKSACMGDGESHVMHALGIDDRLSTIRISFGRETKKGDINQFIRALKEIFAKYVLIHATK